MHRPLRWLLLLCACVSFAFAQDAAKPPQVVHVLGMGDIKHNVKGTLSVKDGALQFVSSSGTIAQVPAGSIQDISIGNDSKRMLGGPIGTMTMLAPYGSGRFLSLFREKLDVLTVAYRDENGGLHGAIFSMTPGAAKPLKAGLLAAGAKSTSPLEEQKPASAEKGTPAADVQPAGEKKEVTK